MERDASGRITRVLRDSNPLADPLNEFDSDSDSEERRKEEAEKQRRYEEWSGFDADNADRPEVVRALEREANRPVEKTVRRQSTREVEWLGRLVERHGGDVGAMARDRRLNPMQQTAADIGRRLRKAGLLEA